MSAFNTTLVIVSLIGVYKHDKMPQTSCKNLDANFDENQPSTSFAQPSISTVTIPIIDITIEHKGQKRELETDVCPDTNMSSEAMSKLTYVIDVAKSELDTIDNVEILNKFWSIEHITSFFNIFLFHLQSKHLYRNKKQRLSKISQEIDSVDDVESYILRVAKTCVDVNNEIDSLTSHKIDFDGKCSTNFTLVLRDFFDWALDNCKVIDNEYIHNVFLKNLNTIINAKYKNIFVKKNIAVVSLINEITNTFLTTDPINLLKKCSSLHNEVLCTVLSKTFLNLDPRIANRTKLNLTDVIRSNVPDLMSCLENPINYSKILKITTKILSGFEITAVSTFGAEKSHGYLTMALKNAIESNLINKSDDLRNLMISSLPFLQQQCTVCMKMVPTTSMCYYTCNHCVCNVCSYNMIPGQCQYHCKAQLKSMGFPVSSRRTYNMP
nr:hypothetical protein NeseNPV-TR_ORF8 [Neodiprion sertifer nucleopolyhedrovirus]